VEVTFLYAPPTLPLPSLPLFVFQSSQIITIPVSPPMYQPHSRYQATSSIPEFCVAVLDQGGASGSLVLYATSPTSRGVCVREGWGGERERVRVRKGTCACGWESVCVWVLVSVLVGGSACACGCVGLRGCRVWTVAHPCLGIDRVCLCLTIAWVYSLSPDVRVSDPEESDGASVPAPGPFRWCFNLDIGDTEGNVTVLLGAVDPAGNTGPLVEQWCAPKRRS
jgi:hypothetical protein